MKLVIVLLTVFLNCLSFRAVAADDPASRYLESNPKAQAHCLEFGISDKQRCMVLLFRSIDLLKNEVAVQYGLPENFVTDPRLSARELRTRHLRIQSIMRQKNIPLNPDLSRIVPK